MVFENFKKFYETDRRYNKLLNNQHPAASECYEWMTTRSDYIYSSWVSYMVYLKNTR